jgi:starch synthase
VNLLKGGLLYADALNTVSKGYAREIQTPEFGFGLDGLLRARSAVLSGILNGVDYDQWSPETDRYIVSNYSVDDLGGKVDCKLDLIHEFGLPEAAMERPLFGIVSRLAAQKGADLIAQIAGWLATQNVSLLVLGSGDAVFEDQFRDMALMYPDHIGVRIGYDNALAHKIEAGADMFLMPSRYEPCGLNQIYSVRYGTVPVVRATGGLDDTIDEGTGFKFADFSTEALMGAIRDACAAFSDRAGWQAMMRRGMQRDFSWKASASEYAALYERLASQSLVA